MPLALALGLVGNLTRHGPSGPRDAADLYGKVKLLLAMDYESNRTKTLKTICLASCWSGVPSASAGLSGPWHWIGVGMRLALQIGLHRETSYAARPDAACLRRVFWHLHVPFSGRPPLLRPGDYDVSLPRPEDFETVSLQSLIFIESTKLWTVLGRASVIVAKGQGPGTQVAGIYATLVDWIGNIPADLHLYETSGCRKGYHRPTAELFIQYFVTIILTWIPRQTEKDFLPAVPPLTVVAASCVASLYDELNCRDEATSLLPLHGFFCLAALLPLVFHRPSEAAREMARRTKIGVLRSILVGMRDRYGDADMALRKIDALDKKVALYEIRDLLSLPEWIDHSLLFPFPEEMCDDMDLLPRTNTPHMEEHIESFGNLVDLPLDYSLLDLFAFDFSDLPGLSESDMNIDTNLGFM
ncbi:hypothetical protein B0I35DRAFT_365353 [Stachybotrys elegans]|uniref:Xylanolytic transcriptional activator regulatory domain-containing protein n=1 Tax=Stachybotrys elegans TaxID=80388 RepID=A0A8K0S867_9HYPO|nr:hypothetical protein B0I35DRAFT_365353 [Stachybotrys elegans]